MVSLPVLSATLENKEVTVDDVQVRSLRFTADGWEYFRIWIVNVALTLLTLGIYSA